MRPASSSSSTGGDAATVPRGMLCIFSATQLLPLATYCLHVAQGCLLRLLVTRDAVLCCAVCCRVLDECDEMLNMGFVDDVELILGAASKNADGSASAAAGPGTNASGEKLQTLLFSATMPSWVKDITRRFLMKEHKIVDLVGDDKLKVGLGTSLRTYLLVYLFAWLEHNTV